MRPSTGLSFIFRSILALKACNEKHNQLLRVKSDSCKPLAPRLGYSESVLISTSPKYCVLRWLDRRSGVLQALTFLSILLPRLKRITLLITQTGSMNAGKTSITAILHCHRRSSDFELTSNGLYWSSCLPSSLAFLRAWRHARQ